MADVSIVTGWGGIYGSGHLRRMLLLGVHLAERYSMQVDICGSGLPAENYSSLPVNFISGPPNNTRLIIHDCRDSSTQVMNSLRNSAPVITIDDVGEGRDFADLAVDLLPNLLFQESFSGGMFLYGYEFYRSLCQCRQDVKRHRKLLYYHVPGMTDLARVQKLVSGNGLLILNDSQVYDSEIKPYKNTGMSPAEAFLSCEYVITHFGILAYEALLCGCLPLFLNPSEYHARLAARERLFADLPQLGTYDLINTDAEEKIKNLEYSYTLKKPSEAAVQVTENLDRFCELLFLYL